MEQPGAAAYLIVDSEVFAYPEATAVGHRLVDGWETVEGMERGLELPEGSLQSTLALYNRHAVEGRDPLYCKDPEWLKPLDRPPFAAFDVLPLRLSDVGGSQDLRRGRSARSARLPDSRALCGGRLRIRDPARWPRLRERAQPRTGLVLRSGGGTLGRSGRAR